MLSLPHTQVHNDMSTQIEAMMKSIEQEHGVIRKPQKRDEEMPVSIKLDGDDPELDYKFKHVIGKGAIGIVRLAVARQSNEKVAVKVIHLKHVKNEMLHNEVETLRKIKEFGGHPTIIDFKVLCDTWSFTKPDWTKPFFWLLNRGSISTSQQCT